MLDEHLEFNDSNDIIDTTVTKEINNNTLSWENGSGLISISDPHDRSSFAQMACEYMKQLDLSEAIRAVSSLIKPAIDTCKKSICKAAAILVRVLRGTMRSVRAHVFSRIKRFIRKCLSTNNRTIVAHARTAALNLIPFISSLLSFYENNSSNIRDVYLKGTHDKSASEDGFNISFQYLYIETAY